MPYSPKSVRSALLPLALLATLALTACNTVEGIGKDFQAMGKSTASAARNTSDTISGKR